MSYDFSNKILLLLSDARQEHTRRGSDTGRPYTDDEIIDSIPISTLTWLLETYKIPYGSATLRIAAHALLVFASEYWSLAARVRRGQADAASQGRPSGRPRKASIVDIWNLHREGLTSHEIARKCGVSDATVSRYLHSECPPEETTKKAV